MGVDCARETERRGSRRPRLRPLARRASHRGASQTRTGRVRAMAREAGRALQEREGAPPLAAERNDAAHRAEPRAEPAGPPRQRAHRRGAARRLFDALGPRHGLGDDGAHSHGPSVRSARRNPRLFQCAADRQNARRSQWAPITRSRSCAISATARRSPSSPRRAAPTSNIDDWGEALWVLGEYLRKYDDPALLQDRDLSRAALRELHAISS